MRTGISFIVFFYFSSLLNAQTRKDITGAWKSYQSDNSTFEYLQLNANGSGIKGFGRTIDGRDTFFSAHFTALLITKWEVKNNMLFLQSKSVINFTPRPDYKLKYENDQLTLEGEHLNIFQYPSHLNRDDFKRTVTYTRRTGDNQDRGTATAKCIVSDPDLFSFQPVDSIYQLAIYKGNTDLIPRIVSCQPTYIYKQTYPDTPYSLRIPSGIRKWTFGFGDRDFYMRFDMHDKEASDATIVIYYDFDNKQKDWFFEELQKGKERAKVVRKNGMDIYTTINWQNKWEGKVFLPNSIVIAYYTGHKNLQSMLQECITSFRYRQD